jgi:hypothetical protein
LRVLVFGLRYIANALIETIPIGKPPLVSNPAADKRVRRYESWKTDFAERIGPLANG